MEKESRASLSSLALFPSYVFAELAEKPFLFSLRGCQALG